MTWGLVALAYLLGSLSSAVLVCRALGQPDPRLSGSGNPGATNVLRQVGKGAAAATLAGDLLKGLLPVALARLAEAPDPVVAATGLAAFLGHLYPVFFQFRGGKGVATFIGVLLGTLWPVAAVFAACWLLVAALFRYSSLAALSASVASLPAAWWLAAPAPVLLALGVMVLLLLWRHQDNIRRLLAGTESRIGRRPADGPR